MTKLINKSEVEAALAEAAKSNSWQKWERHNRAGQFEAAGQTGSDTNAAYEVLLFKIPMSQLQALPRERLSAFLVASKIANELLLLQRQTIVQQNSVLKAADGTDKDELTALDCVLFTTLTLLAAKLWESYEALRTFSGLWKLGSGLALPAEGQETKRLIDSAFGNGSPLAKIRNRVSFHFDAKLLHEEATRRASTDGDYFDLLLSTDYTNTLYITTEAITAFAVLEIVGPTLDKQAAMDHFYDLVVGNAGLMMRYATIVVTTILDEGVTFCEGQSVAMRHRSKLDEIPSPFLVWPPKR